MKDPVSTKSNGPARASRVGMSIGDTRFDEEIRAFLQRRLRILTSSVSLIFLFLSVGFVIALANDPARTVVQAVVYFCTRFPNAVLFFLTFSSSILALILLRKRVEIKILRIVDAIFLQVLIGPCLYLFARFHYFSFSGFPVVVPFLMLFILARGIFIPSRALWTAALSLPAALGVFLIQLNIGMSYAFPGQAFDKAHFIDMIIQNQVLILGAILVAAGASRVNLGLRLENFEARRVGQYKIEHLLGKGGMGEVYLAKHSLLKRPTAIKFLRPEIAGIHALERFEKEVHAASRLTHPNNVSIYDYGHTAEGVFYYAMEYLAGLNLRQIIQAAGPMSPARVIHVLASACGALKEAHEKGIIHRDIKPENIMLCEHGGEKDIVKILDFGLVKDLQNPSAPEIEEDSISGTPETISPETLSGGAIGPGSDIYSLCAVGCYLLTGQPIFDACSVLDFLKSHQYSTPIRPSKRIPGIPRDLEEVLLQGLRKNPSSRPESMAALKIMLLDCKNADGWKQSDAEVWWQKHGELFEREDESVNPQHTQTLTEGDAATMSLTDV